MATVLDTFITRFAFQTDETGLNKAEKGLSSLKESAFKIAAVAGSILGGGFFLTQTAQAAVNTQKFADSLGLTIEQMSEMDFVSKKLNVNIETLRGQAFNLTQALNEAAKTGAGITDDLTRFGLSATDAAGRTKDFTTFIDEVRVKMQSLTAIERADLADKLFFDEETIALLTVAPERIAEITKEARRLGTLTRQDAAKAAQFQDGLINIAQGIENIKFTIGGLIFEPLTRGLKVIEEGFIFFNKHKDTFTKLAKSLRFAGAAFLAMGLRAAAAWILAMGPISLVIAAIAGISIALDDISAWMDGHPSALGDAMAKWPEFEELVLNVAEAIKFTKDQFIDLWNFLPKVGNAIREAVGLDPIDYDEIEKDVVIKRTGAVPNKTIKDIFSFDPKLQSILFGTETAETQDNLRGQLPITNDINKLPVLQRTNTINIENINVDATGGDSKEIAQNTGKELKTQLQNTVEDFDSNVGK